MHYKAKKNTTYRLQAAYKSATSPGVTGLTVTMRILRRSDSKYLKNDATWTASPSTEYTATEASATNRPGVYYFDFALPNTLDTYDVRFDAGSTLGNDRYLYGTLEAVGMSDADVNKLRAFMVNKRSQDVATGIVTVYDDDAVTTLLTLTPSGTDTTLTMTPS